MAKLYWESSYAIVLALMRYHPDRDPEQTGLHEMLDIIENLPGFDDDPSIVTERILKDIQISWFEEKSSL
ncbi:MAG: FeS assembly protein IscX [Candidatus Promineifilaceae bacterium]|jgi:FeS assembly protein IscX